MRMQKTYEDYSNQILSAVEQKDAKRVLQLSEDMVADGYYETCVSIGKGYEYGEGGIKTDLDKARKYYELSIEKLQSVEGMLCLARLYYFGWGVTRDLKIAFDYYKKVAEKNDHAFAYYMLGKMYYLGEYVSVDYDQAKKYFEKGWEKGHVYSLTFLALIEQKQGRFLNGLKLRLKAMLCVLKIPAKDTIDPRLRRQ